MRRMLVLVLALAACAEKQAVAPEPSSLVELAVVTRGPIEEIVTDLGVIEPDPDQVRTLLFPRSGRIERVYVANGDAVSAGTPLLRLGAMPSDSAELRRAEIEAKSAQRELERVQRLHEDGLADNSALASARTAADTASAALAALGGGAGSGGIELRAPVDGVVVSALPAPGSLAAGGDTAAELAPRGAFVAHVAFAGENAARLQPGQPATLEALFTAPDAARAHGHLEPLRARVDADTQQIDGLVRLDDAPPWLASGARVRVRTVVASAGAVLRVPREALVHRNGGVGVFVAADGRAHWRDVDVGIGGDDAVEARAGVHEGEHVITAGRTGLEDGAHVREADAAAQK